MVSFSMRILDSDVLEGVGGESWNGQSGAASVVICSIINDRGRKCE